MTKNASTKKARAEQAKRRRVRAQLAKQWAATIAGLSEQKIGRVLNIPQAEWDNARAEDADAA